MIKRPYSLPSQYIFESTVLLIVLLGIKKYILQPKYKWLVAPDLISCMAP